MKRIAVDIGGTFTDIVYIDESTMQIIVDKARSTPSDIGQAVIDAITKINVDVPDVSLFIHGTTAGINTIVQHKGSKVGLLTTRGFIDILEMARGNKKELYDYMWKKPRPMVPRYLRLPVNERINHLGEIVEKLDEKQAREAVKKLKENGVEAVAICLLHSYSNPAHEQMLGEIVTEIMPDATLALSHQIAREIREYERTSTTVINAYIEKAVVNYLSKLNTNLYNIGFRGQKLVLGPSGVLGIEAVKEKAIYTLASGPIGGAAGAAYLARLLGIKDVVTMDVGGTSFDVSVIKEGMNVEKYQGEIMGFPVLMAGVDIRPIGAGGGSIARVDAAGLLTVGPDSAGADPGPMAYNTGGTEPTVTDAALVNGLIDPNYFVGGEFSLDIELSRKGVKGIADRLGLDINQAADGILAVARNSMTTATTEILIGEGLDPRDFTLMSFGGGGGIFATHLAEDMSISRIIIPVAPGVFSARGILAMNIVHSYAQAYNRAMDEMDMQELEGIYTGMEENAMKILLSESMTEDTIEFARSLDICYEGQRYYVDTPVPSGKLKEKAGIKKEISSTFERLYETRYGHLINAPLRTLNARLKATGKIKEIPGRVIEEGKEIPPAAIKKKRKVFLDGAFHDTDIYERAGLLCGNVISGPAIIEEPFHTTVVMKGQTLHVDKMGNLIIHTGGV
jgi:N-methylhydantoinase A